ncbi:MAG: RibD family protein [Myxococcota bacterium]
MLGSLATGDDLAALYAPLLGAEMASRPYVVAHLAQSLDGCIALPAGESQWISGHDDLVHTHRLRALCDAVLVGARTVMHDDPQLTVRHVEGPHPLRVILDPRGRLNANYQVFEGGPERTLVVARAPRPDLEGRVEVVLLPSDEAWVAPSVVLEVLAQRGIQRVLVEGGGITVSRFLEAGLVDRLHLVMAPLLVGLGRPSLSGSLGATLASCPRPSTRVWPLGQDWLFDCVFA